MKHTLYDARTIGRLNGLPVNVRPIFGAAPPTMWLALTWPVVTVRFLGKIPRLSA